MLPVDLTSERFPFPTKEPQEYQGYFVVSDGTSETQYFVARKADKWRFDIGDSGSPKTTQVRTDKVYLIDHVNKAYAIEAFADLEDFDTSYFNSLTWGFSAAPITSNTKRPAAVAISSATKLKR